MSLYVFNGFCFSLEILNFEEEWVQILHEYPFISFEFTNGRELHGLGRYVGFRIFNPSFQIEDDTRDNKYLEKEIDLSTQLLIYFCVLSSKAHMTDQSW